MKKKEELAEGLHLIDFEQLKIENQTWNEKIEERNEELHKLKKKNTTTVQILTHTREKYGFVQKKNQDLISRGQEKEKELGNLRKNLSDIKKAKESLRIKNAMLRQQTGIVNNQDLIIDFDKRMRKIKDLQEEKEQIRNQWLEMKAVIDMWKQKVEKVDKKK